MTDPLSLARIRQARYRERHRTAYNHKKKLEMRERRKQERLERIAEAGKKSECDHDIDCDCGECKWTQQYFD